MLVKKLKQIAVRLDPVTKKPIAPKEQKVYMVLLFLDDETRSFELVHTRKEAFEICLQHMEDCDIATSQVMTNKHTMEDCISIYSFVRGCLEAFHDLALEADLDLDQLNEWCIQSGKNPDEVWKDDMGEEE